MQDTLQRHLRERFPDRELEIMRLQREHLAFRDLCRDYEDCVRVLEVLWRSPASGSQRLKEYCDLRLALETEILGFLERPA